MRGELKHVTSVNMNNVKLESRKAGSVRMHNRGALA
jgi:hypothetical protein